MKLISALVLMFVSASALASNPEPSAMAVANPIAFCAFQNPKSEAISLAFAANGSASAKINPVYNGEGQYAPFYIYHTLKVTETPQEVSVVGLIPTSSGIEILQMHLARNATSRASIGGDDVLCRVR